MEADFVLLGFCWRGGVVAGWEELVEDLATGVCGQGVACVPGCSGACAYLGDGEGCFGSRGGCTVLIVEFGVEGEVYQ